MNNINSFEDFLNEAKKKEAKKETKKAMPEKGTPNWHQLQVAKKTMGMSDAGASIMGGMTKEEAKKLLTSYGIKIKE